MAGKKSALTEPQVDEIVEKYNCGFGATIPALAREYDVAPASVRYRLNQRGVLNTGAPMTQPMTPPETPKAELDLSDPAIQAALDQAIAARISEMMAQMVPPAPAEAAAPAAAGDQTNEFAGMMSRMFEVLSMQQPGYKKPLSPDEVERRLAGKVEMEALLARHKAGWERDSSHVLPEWRVGERGFFECVNAVTLEEGTEFSTYLPPVEDFEPLNKEAEAVHRAMMQWLGGPTPDIGETVKQAHLDAKRVIVPGALVDATPRGPINVTKHASEATPRTKRQFGTIVEEPKQIAGGRNSDPVGPAFEAA